MIIYAITKKNEFLIHVCSSIKKKKRIKKRAYCILRVTTSKVSKKVDAEVSLKIFECNYPVCAYLSEVLKNKELLKKLLKKNERNRVCAKNAKRV